MKKRIASGAVSSKRAQGKTFARRTSKQKQIGGLWTLFQYEPIINY